MVVLVEVERIRDHVENCYRKQLNTRLVQIHWPRDLGSSNEKQPMGFTEAIDVRGVHKYLFKAAFQGIPQQLRELYQAYKVYIC